MLAGALIVGSSVRESLRNLTLDRLGAIDFAAVGERYFREGATEAFAAFDQAASAVLIRGSAEHADSNARASKVRIHGVDRGFWAFYALDVPEIGNREVALNRRLASELGAEEGDDLLLRFQTDALVPAESVMGRKADNVRLLRLKVSSVLDDSGPGRFGLSPQQQLPYNAFVSKPTLQRALEQPGRANALFVSGGTLDEARSAWYENFSLEDARLVVRTLPAERGALIESERVVLDPAAVTSIAAAADASAWHSSEVPYLSRQHHRIRRPERSVLHRLRHWRSIPNHCVSLTARALRDSAMARFCSINGRRMTCEPNLATRSS